MKIRKLKLFTNRLELEKVFYSQTLGFKITEGSSNSFTVEIGWSDLTFEKTEIDCNYHYCFLIPSNKLDEAMKWMEKRVSVIEIEKGRKIQNFESWNADSFYFYDASGNITEFIARQELENAISSDFKISDVLCVNEIGMPTNNIEKANTDLSKNFGTEFWKGDIKRFGTNGSQEGLFILPNYKVKKKWFPSDLKIKPEPFEIQLEHNDKIFNMEYKNGKISTSAGFGA